jgi:hypothetical protein
MAHSVLIHSVKDLELCGSCARELTAIESEAVAPLVVDAFAQFLRDWSTTLPTGPCRQETAHHFWTSLASFGDAIDLSDVTRALEALIARRPRDLEALID